MPTMFIAQLDHPEFDRFDLSSLRTGIMAGSNCPIDTMRQVLRKMHMAEVSICYGMTETSPVSFQTDIDDPPELRCETVGRIHPHVECRVVDDKGMDPQLLGRHANAVSSEQHLAERVGVAQA